MLEHPPASLERLEHLRCLFRHRLQIRSLEFHCFFPFQPRGPRLPAYFPTFARIVNFVTRLGGVIRRFGACFIPRFRGIFPGCIFGNDPPALIVGGTDEVFRPICNVDGHRPIGLHPLPTR